VVFQYLPTRGRNSKIFNTVSIGFVLDLLKRTYHNMHHGAMGGFAFKAAAADAFQVCCLSTCPKTVVFLTPDAYHIRI
jgi:hypothetical protein